MSRKEKVERTEEEEEVHIKKVRILGAIAGLIVAGAFYVALPYFMSNYFLNEDSEYFWKLSLAKLPIFENMDFKIDVVSANLILMFNRWFYAGIPMVVLGFLTWMMPKGSRQRFVMSTIYLAGSIVWLLYVLNFGDLSGLIKVVTYDRQTFELGIVLTFMLYLLVLFRALKFLIIYGIYKDERDKYLDGE